MIKNTGVAGQGFHDSKPWSVFDEPYGSREIDVDYEGKWPTVDVQGRLCPRQRHKLK